MATLKVYVLHKGFWHTGPAWVAGVYPSLALAMSSRRAKGKWEHRVNLSWHPRHEWTRPSLKSDRDSEEPDYYSIGEHTIGFGDDPVRELAIAILLGDPAARDAAIDVLAKGG